MKGRSDTSLLCFRGLHFERTDNSRSRKVCLFYGKIKSVIRIENYDRY